MMTSCSFGGGEIPLSAYEVTFCQKPEDLLGGIIDFVDSDPSQNAQGRLASYVTALSNGTMDSVPLVEFARKAQSGRAQMFEIIFHEKHIVTQNSPIELRSLEDLIKQSPGAAVGAYTGFQAAAGEPP